MTRLTHSTMIEAPIDTVFAFLLDPARLVRAYPADHGELEAPEPPAVVGSTFTWNFHILGIPTGMTMVYTAVAPDDHVTLDSSRGVEFRFKVERVEGGTKLTLTEEDVPSSWFEAAIDTVAMKLTEHDVEDWLANIATALEAEPTS